MGANLDENQIENIYKVFGIKRETLRNPCQHRSGEKYLEGLVDSAKMGSRSYSSIYIETLPEGSGIEVETHNIDWCSKEMCISALTTAGVEDCKVVAAPFNVSGTAALTGVYLAYEDMSGEEMDELAKQIGAEELTVTAELAEKLGAIDSVEIVNELKLILDETRNMTDEELRAEIIKIADRLGVTLTDSQIDKLISLCRSLEKMDPDELKEKVDSVKRDTEDGGGQGETNFSENSQRSLKISSRRLRCLQNFFDIFRRVNYLVKQKTEQLLLLCFLFMS